MLCFNKKPARRLFAVFIGAMVLLAAVGEPLAKDFADQIASGGHVLMLRHAYAPGSGDPAGFVLGDCATQRNLNEQGRSQARVIGAWLRARGVAPARVYSSQWCRCLETAKLIGLGPVTELPALNSFFQRPKDREPNLTALRAFMAEQPADGELIVLVTHFVTISGMTGEGVSSGEGVVLKLDGKGGFDAIGRIGFDS